MSAIHRLRKFGSLFFVFSSALAMPLAAGAAPAWNTVASLATNRAEHSATRLASGKVLVAGGYTCTASPVSCSNTTSAELYDPSANTWSPAGTLATGRAGHTATLLGNGKVLIVGGRGGAELASAELYDPASNTWSAAASLHVAREYHTATLLPSGKVLVAGGGGGCSDGHCTGQNGVYPPAEATSELYDPANNTWTVVASLIVPRANPAAVLLQNGQVLISGGIACIGTIALDCAAGDNELYDPASNVWTATSAYNHYGQFITATLLPTGDALIAGGLDGSAGYQSASAGSATYTPGSNAWQTVGNLTNARSYHTATLLGSGQVLAVGGRGGASFLATSELYDPTGKVWYTQANLTLNTARTNHTATLLTSGKVLVTGGYGANSKPLTSAEVYDPALNAVTVTATAGANGSITPATQTVSSGLPANFTVTPNAGYHAVLTGDTCSLTQTRGTIWTSTPITTGCVVTATFAANAGNGLWSATDSMSVARIGHTATRLASGKVLVASSGSNFSGYSQTSAEVYDPANSTWTPAGNLATARFADTATLLPSGKVLVAGGSTGLYSYLASAEIYDPASNSWSAAASMSATHYYHTATLLPSGKVLIAGGGTTTAELYDPASNTWSPAGTLAVARVYHTATLLPSGKVLIAGGGTSAFAPLASAELYDPASNTWSSVPSLTSARLQHTATLLPSGKVLVVGGYNSCNGNAGCVFLASAELYDPASNTWSTGGGLATPRAGHTASLLPSGQVLIAGGTTSTNLNCDNYGANCTVLADSELYDPTGNDFSPTASLITQRTGHTAIVLTSGDVLAVGGLGSSANSSTLASAEIYGPASNVFNVTANAGANGSITPAAAIVHAGSHVVFAVSPALGYHASVTGNACAVAQSSGTIWVSNGITANCTVTASFATNAFAGTWAATGSLANARQLHTATLLPSGKVLVVGGADTAMLASAELYDPASGSWSAAATPIAARALHTATLLPSGKVLVVGGGPVSAPLASAEIYDPASNTWSAAASLANARTQHTASLLASGKVLISGGIGSSGILGSVELYDPASNSWSAAGNLASARWAHTATLLSSGKVLVAGGRSDLPSQQHYTPPVLLGSAEIYDPNANTWSAASSLSVARAQHSATLLPSGRVLIVGGTGASGSALVSAEQYDPASNTWSGAGGLIDARSGHSATLSPSGQVLVAGGSQNNGLTSAELYDPSSTSWSATASLLTGRANHSATLLSNGKILASGGYTRIVTVNNNVTTYTYAATATAELYGAANSNTFAITTVASPVAGGSVSCTPNPVTQGGVASCTVTTANGYTLSTISGCGGTASTTSPYATGAINAACTVTATFTANTVTSFPITTVASPNAGGSVSCTPNPVTQGGVASCTATAASGYTLASISGCGGTTSTTSPYATGPVNAACTVTATFTANTVTSFPITAVASPNAGGSVSCSPNPVTQGGVASCTATAASGYTLTNISGCGGTTSTTSPYATGPVNAACTVTATFTANTVTSFPITAVASPNAGGSVTCSPNPVTQGGVASCTATAASGYTLASISGCGGTTSTTSPYATGAINAACTVTATFTANTVTSFPITTVASPNAGGSVSCTPNPVTQGGVASCTVTTANGYTLSTISGCGGTASTTSPYATGAINAACTVTATFTPVSAVFTISLTSSPNPSLAGQSVTFIATVTQAEPTNATRTTATSDDATNIAAAVTGSVVFTDNGLPLATVALNAQGVATYQISSLGAGSHTIVATFGSNSTTTSSVVQQVQAVAPTTAATPAPALSLSMLLLLACAVALLAAASVRGVAPNPRG